ncbi:MAG TPA: thioredoxin-disulfide reductase [Gemmatimonadales bacterium]|nr:thioredoxin-disulfide reductase [Gemmatimonadales bacterium]
MTTAHDFDFDTIIIGGGPAGLCAAMYAGRGMLKAVLLESKVPGGELLNTEKVEDYPGFESILGRELAERMTAHAVKFGADIRQATVESIERLPDGSFEVKTVEGDVYRAPTVILTAGGTPTKLQVPGESEYAGFGVSYCAVCDGAFFRNQTIAVVGGGDAAVEEAEYLTRYAAKVYLIHRRDQLRASRLLQERLFANPKIEVLWNKKVLEICGREQAGLREVTGLRLEDTVSGKESRLDVNGCFVFIGFRPNSGLIRGHFRHDASGYVITDDRMMTSIPGLFAAGDLRVQLVRQVTTAVGDATTAALAVEKYLAERRSRVGV